MIPNAEDCSRLNLKNSQDAARILEFHRRAVPFAQRYNFSLPGQSPADSYPSEYRERVNRALTEAWSWLEREV